MDILMMLILPIHEHSLFFHLFVSSLISFFSVIQFSEDRSFTLLNSPRSLQALSLKAKLAGIRPQVSRAILVKLALHSLFQSILSFLKELIFSYSFSIDLDGPYWLELESTAGVAPFLKLRQGLIFKFSLEENGNVCISFF